MANRLQISHDDAVRILANTYPENSKFTKQAKAINAQIGADYERLASEGVKRRQRH